MLDRLLKKSRVYFLSGDLQKSRSTLTKAIPVAEALADDPSSLDTRIRLFNNLGAVCSKTFDFSSAKKYILRASELVQQAEPQRWDLMVGIYGNMGVLEYQEGNLDNARMNFQIAKSHLQKVSDPELKQQRAQDVLFNLARLYLKMGLLEDAFNEIRELNEIPAGSDQESDYVTARHHQCTGRLVAELANDSVQPGQPRGQSFADQSLEHFSAALEIYERLNNRYRAWLCTIDMLRLMFDTGRAGPGQEVMLRKAETYARENPTEGMRALMSEIRIQYHVACGDNDEARKLIEEFIKDPPDLPQLNLVQVYGKLKAHAAQMEDERTVELIDDAIRQIANAEAGVLDSSLN